jgi:molybdopterin-guanine dinucleotide biosynthesis protein MobB
MRLAARAALAFQETATEIAAANPDWPRFRVGVNSGEIASGVVGDRGHRKHDVIGDTVNLAARLESQAPVGGVLIGEGTRRASPTRRSSRSSRRCRSRARPSRSPPTCSRWDRPARPPVELEQDRDDREGIPIAPPVCGVVGSSGAGKTELIRRLVPELTERGLRIGYLKHAAHGFEIDRPGSDSQRLRDVGTPEVVLVGPDELVRMEALDRGAPSLAALVRGFRRCDLVLVEGFSGDAHPKIRVRAVGAAARSVRPPVLLDLERPADGWQERDVASALDTVLGVVEADTPPASWSRT